MAASTGVAPPRASSICLATQKVRVHRVLDVGPQPAVHVLDRVRHAVSRLCRPPLGGEHLGLRLDPGIERPDGAQVGRAQRLDVDVTVRKAMLHRLEASQRAPELAALADVGGRAAQRLGHHAQLQCRKRHVGTLERPGQRLRRARPGSRRAAPRAPMGTSVKVHQALRLTRG